MGSNAPTERTSDDPLLGCVLQGRYRIKRQLGQGGMGAVYEGEHLLIGNPVAVKVLHAKHAADPAIIERFRREAQATTLIRHHHIVGVLDLGQLDDGSLYLVMEHLDGRDWSSDLSNEGPQPVAKVVHILSQVCDALGAAHEAGIVHRDIKPDNIFLIRRSGDPNQSSLRFDGYPADYWSVATSDRTVCAAGPFSGTAVVGGETFVSAGGLDGLMVCVEQ